MTKLDTCECPVCGSTVEWDLSTQEALVDFLLWLCKRLFLRTLDGVPADVGAEILQRLDTCRDPVELKALFHTVHGDTPRDG